MKRDNIILHAGKSVNASQLRKIGGKVLAAVLLLLLPTIISSNYVMRIVNVAGIFIIVTIGFNVLFGLTGLVSFGQAGFMAIGAYTLAIATTQFGLPPTLGFVLALITSTLAGLILGFPTLRLKGHYLVVATMAFGEIVRLVALNWKPVTGGYDGLRVPYFNLFGWIFKGDRAIYFAILFFVLVCFLAANQIKKSTYGRAMMAIRDSETAAEVMGIDSTRIKMLSFAISALFAGLGGALYGHLFRFISPDAFDARVSLNVVGMLLVGGLGSNLGALIGAIILTFLPEVMRIGDKFYMVIYGIVFMLIVVFVPGGILGLIERARKKYKSKPKNAQAAETEK